VEEKNNQTRSGWRGRTAVTLLLGVSAVAVAFALAEGTVEIDMRGQGSESEAVVFGGAVGATVEPLDRVTAKGLGIASREMGLVVTSLARNGAATKAGVRAGDVIEQIGATRVASLHDAATALAGSQGPIVLTVNRGGHYAIVTLPISLAPTGPAKPEQGDAR
jgi:S1-C subfamily serine protease